MKCRVCGRKATTRRHDKAADPCRSVLSTVYGIAVDTESAEIYPPEVCNSCYLVLRRASAQADPGRVLKIVSWEPHTDACPTCSMEGAAGRPKKLKRGRPSDTDEQYMGRNIIRAISDIGTIEFADFPLTQDMFLPSPYLTFFVCQCCQCMPGKPLEILTCRHYLCVSCIISGCNEGTVACTCNNLTLCAEQLCAPAEMAMAVMGGLLLRCNRCAEVMELRHLMAHLRSSCHVTEIPPPSKITVDQLMRRFPSKMDTHTTALVVEHLIPAIGQVTFTSPKGKV